MKIFIFRFLISLILIISPCCANSYVSLSPALTEIIYALDGEKNLLGISSICNYPKETKNKEIIGDTFYVNMEKIAKLKPDYFFSMKSNKPLLGQLPLLKIKPLYFEFEKVEDIYSAISTISEIINKEKNAQKLINNIKKEIEKNKTATPQNILYVVQINPLIVIGNRSYINDVIKISGNNSVTSEINSHYPNITFEYILKTKPDFIIVAYGNGNIATIEKLFPKTKIIQLTKIQQDIINRPGPRVFEAIKLLNSLGKN